MIVIQLYIFFSPVDDPLPINYYIAEDGAIRKEYEEQLKQVSKLLKHKSYVHPTISSVLDLLTDCNRIIIVMLRI